MQHRRFTHWLSAAALACAATAAGRARLAKGSGAGRGPYAAGSTPDLLARMLSERLRVRLGKPWSS